MPASRHGSHPGSSRPPVPGVRRAVDRGRGTCRSPRADARLPHRAVPAGRAEEHRADGRPGRSAACPRAAPVDAPLCGQCPVGRRRPSSAWRATGCSRRWPDTARWPRGLWMTRATPRRGGTRSGVTRQYCGPLGKQDNCQVAVSVSLANDAVSLPVAYRLYLPESWAQDRRRRRAVGVPDDLKFQPKWQLALAQIRTLQAEGRAARAGGGGCRLRRHDRVSRGPDRGGPGLRGGRERGDDGVASRRGPPAAEAAARRPGPPTIRVRRTAPHQPVSLKRLAAELPAAGVADGDVARGHAGAPCAPASRGSACGPPIAMRNGRTPGRKSGC